MKNIQAEIIQSTRGKHSENGVTVERYQAIIYYEGLLFETVFTDRDCESKSEYHSIHREANGITLYSVFSFWNDDVDAYSGNFCDPLHEQLEVFIKEIAAYVNVIKEVRPDLSTSLGYAENGRFMRLLHNLYPRFEIIDYDNGEIEFVSSKKEEVIKRLTRLQEVCTGLIDRLNSTEDKLRKLKEGK